MIPGWRKVADIAAERGLRGRQADALVVALRAASEKFPGLVRQFRRRGHWYVNEEVAIAAGCGELFRRTSHAAIEERLESIDRKADEILESVSAIRVCMPGAAIDASLEANAELLGRLAR